MRKVVNILFVVISVLIVSNLYPQPQSSTNPIQTNPHTEQLRERNQNLYQQYSTVKQLLIDNSFSSDTSVISNVSSSIVKYTNKYNIDIDLAYGIVMEENPWLVSDTVSHAGAYGIFQIMPQYWANTFPECGDYTTIDGNVCIGIRIIQHYLDTNTTVEGALLAYNGCHWEACSGYSDNVYSYIDDFRLFSLE